MPRILIVDDDRETCRFMEELLGSADRVFESAHTPSEALSKAENCRFDLVISDINLDDALSGIDLLRAFKRADPQVEVVLISGFGTLQTAIDAARMGAFDYVSKPFDIGEVKETVDRALRRRCSGGPTSETITPEPAAPDGLFGRSRAMLALYKQIAHASNSDSPVLITGETGTGKELVAQAIHRHGRRGGHAFVPVNCGALAEGLLESELFGHVRGAFTGAVVDKKGLFEQAHGGTIFLDEVGETSAAVQVRLLRALELGEIRPVGASRALTVDVRVVAATHQDVEAAVARGSFRQDLFYRLNVFRIQVPALRDRPEDIPLLVAHFLQSATERGGPRAVISSAAMAALTAYSWPGNVRELENTVERMILEAHGGTIELEDLPQALQAPHAAWQQQLFADLPSLDEMEKRYLKHVLAVLKGNRSRVAEILGIHRRTLYRMAERLGVDLGENG